MAKYIAEPRAVVLADSLSPSGHRLTTMEVTMHRFVLAEFNTHRVFSRNSASSRAIPGRTQRERVLTSPAVPLEWPEKLAGMQGGTELPENIQRRAAAFWRKAALDAATTAAQLDKMGVHKSVTNRLLEPFLMQTVIVTSTEWDNFFGLRANELAQPEIRVAAELMQEAYDNSKPYPILTGEWHLPLIHDEDVELAEGINMLIVDDGPESARVATVEEVLCRVSAARCARVSYLTHDGERDLEKDLELYVRLVSADPPHASPLEHVATPCDHKTHELEEGTVFFGHYGNFTGWDQLRHLV